MDEMKKDGTCLRGEVIIELKGKDDNLKLRHVEKVVIEPAKYEDCSVVCDLTSSMRAAKDSFEVMIDS
jgi:hypothetical protein